MITEFQRLLMLNTSILQSFKHNIRQVSPAILAIARTTKRSQAEIKAFVNLLDDENVEEDALDSLGKYILVYLEVFHQVHGIYNSNKRVIMSLFLMLISICIYV